MRTTPTAAAPIQVRPTYSYRCTTRRLDAPLQDTAVPADFIQLKAANAEEAQRLAFLITGRAVVDATRMEG